MDCKNGTAPINIYSSKNKCKLKCKYQLKYQGSTTTITKKKNYLTLSHENINPSPVTFNSKNYQVSEIRIYVPSLHTYNGKKADGEILIIHESDYDKMIVSLPILNNSSSDTASSTLKNIISQSLRDNVNQDTQTVYQKGINLNDFIPTNKKFYTYKGTLPYPPCTGNINYIIFDQSDHYISIDNSLLLKLKKHISPSESIIKKNNLYVNMDGATSTSNQEDEIYIDCRPVTDDEKEPSQSNDDSNIFNDLDINKILNSILFQIIIAFIVFFIIIYCAKFAFSKMKTNIQK